MTDGGDLDDDGVANGVILDPVGLAVDVLGGSVSGSYSSASNGLADTGQRMSIVVAIAFLSIIASGLYLVHRRIIRSNDYR